MSLWVHTQLVAPSLALYRLSRSNDTTPIPNLPYLFVHSPTFSTPCTSWSTLPNHWPSCRFVSEFSSLLHISAGTLTISFFSATLRIVPPLPSRCSDGSLRAGVSGAGLGGAEGSMPRVNSDGNPRDLFIPLCASGVDSPAADWVRVWCGRAVRLGVAGTGESLDSSTRDDLEILPARLLLRRVTDAPKSTDGRMERGGCIGCCSVVTRDGGDGPTDTAVFLGGTTVADDEVDEPELARELGSSRGVMRLLRCAAAQALESRRVNDPSSSSLRSSGDDGTGVSVDTLLDIDILRLLDGVWNPRLGLAGLRGVCGTKGRPMCDAPSETSELEREWAGDGMEAPVMSCEVTKEALDASPATKPLPNDEVDVDREAAMSGRLPISGILVAPSGSSQK